VMGVRVGQASDAFSAQTGSSRANHMSAIENGRNIELSSAHLSLLGNARIYLPSRPLDMKKGALPSILTPVVQQRRRDRLMITLTFWYRSSNGLSFGACST
jgi:hypothetical protein